MANNVNNVKVGKPAVNGGIWHAAADTTLPADASTALDAAFKCLGYISEDGVTIESDVDSDTIKAWGGDVVLTPVSGRTFTFQFVMIESDNIEVLKVAYGADNVTENADGHYQVDAKNYDDEGSFYIIDTMDRAGTPIRYLIPNASVTDMGETTLSDSDAVGYDITLTAKASNQLNGAAYRMIK